MPEHDADRRNGDLMQNPYRLASDEGKLRILHSVGHLLRGGIEGWLYEIVRSLDRDRYEHHVMVWTDASEAFTHEFRDAGVTLHAFPNYKNIASFSRGFRRLVRRNGPFDILHTHGTQFHGLVMLLGRMAGIRTRIAHSHTDIRPVLRRAGPIYRAYAAIGHHAIRSLATAGLACSDMAAVSMFGANWQADPRWRILQYGIDLTPFAEQPDTSMRARLGIPPGALVIGHVGRFELQKNHSFLLEIAAAFLERRRDAHFLLIGDGSLYAGFTEAVARRGLTHNFTFLRDCRTVAQHMTNAMDAFLFPSIYEGLGIVAIEAQAAGLPCLMSTDVPEEAAFDAALARRVALSEGAPAWADALMNLPDRIDPLDAGLRTRFEQSGFNIQRSASSLASIYEAAVSATRAGSSSPHPHPHPHPPSGGVRDPRLVKRMIATDAGR